MDHEIVHACLLMKKLKLMKNSNDEQILLESDCKTHCAVVEDWEEGAMQIKIQYQFEGDISRECIQLRPLAL